MLGRHRLGMLLRLTAVDIQPQHAALQRAAGSGEPGVFRLDGMNAGRGLLRRGLVLMRGGAGRRAMAGSGLRVGFRDIAGHRVTSFGDFQRRVSARFRGWMRNAGCMRREGIPWRQMAHCTGRGHADRLDRRYAVRTT